MLEVLLNPYLWILAYVLAAVMFFAYLSAPFVLWIWQQRLKKKETHFKAEYVRSLNDLAKEVNKINSANGWAVPVPGDWSQPYKVPTMLALIHTEVSEATEGFRENDKENFIEEMADVVIRVLDLTGGLGMDLDKAILQKLEKNKKRAYKHGGKRI